MKFFRSFIGYLIAGVVVMAVWGELGKFGIFGGFLAAGIIIGPLWYMNHYVNLTGNLDDASFVDMGLAIGVCGIMRDTFMTGTSSLIDSIPTILLVIVGSALGGIVAAAIEKSMAKDDTFETESPEPGMNELELNNLKNKN
ncbi:Lin0368 family putative glycerol transporter subunit [Vagococcus xieshaowenii]|uniref:Uncharacterized protein n=1 Tax=Vagococcus xieshaowenii TaxID=2562451 RepID=A0AAJ5JLC0_9ENTE|nr:hypothetical protein [Vagococcus xieshaowenii]QCA29421.1 hypothetical protein E4Z98_08870 [Vagococcus xieshaowenii]TFZ41542.1 hypothetical protein E4031_04945 [Vagococcus xieshaowenii]